MVTVPFMSGLTLSVMLGMPAVVSLFGRCEFMDITAMDITAEVGSKPPSNDRTVLGASLRSRSRAWECRVASVTLVPPTGVMVTLGYVQELLMVHSVAYW